MAGISLVVAAAVVLLGWQWGIRSSEQQAKTAVHTIRTLIPEPESAVLEERSDNAMAVLSINGTNFAGILELPVFGAALPVCADWGRISRYPCCLSGSIYDRSVQIGATSQKGQFDFYREISAGDTLFFTDMTGNRYAYTVTDLRYEKHADQAALQRKEAALTLFIKNVYAFEYLVVYCEEAR